MEKAIVLLSGGLDSATCLAIARERGFECYTLSFDYGQRHRCELECSANIARALGAAKHSVMTIDLRQWGGSALTDDSIDVPAANDEHIMPVTYVPARNMIFLSFAAAWGEILKARHIFIGVNSVDYSGYPDCRATFIDSFRRTADLGTCASDEGWNWALVKILQSIQARKDTDLRFQFFALLYDLRGRNTCLGLLFCKLCQHGDHVGHA